MPKNSLSGHSWAKRNPNQQNSGNSLAHSFAEPPITQNLVLPPFLGGQCIIQPKPHVQTVTVTLPCLPRVSASSISAFSQNEGANSKSLLSIVSPPVSPTPPCSVGHCGSSPALSGETSSSLGLCPQKGKTQPMLQKGTAGEIPREEGPTLELKALGGTGRWGHHPGLLCCHQERSHSYPERACGCCRGLGLLQFTRRSPEILTWGWSLSASTSKEIKT